MSSIEQSTSRFYTQAEVSGEDQQWLDGTAERLVRVRFRTIDVTDAGESEGLTEWVTFTLNGLEHLSVQLAAAVETIRRWQPGQDPEAVGANLGIAARNVRAYR